MGSAGCLSEGLNDYGGASFFDMYLDSDAVSAFLLGLHLICSKRSANFIVKSLFGVLTIACGVTL